MAIIKLEGEQVIDLSTKEVAAAIWSMGSDEQADMLEELIKLSDGSHLLMMQFLGVREECEKRDSGTALEAFQAMFASAYKYMWT